MFCCPTTPQGVGWKLCSHSLIMGCENMFSSSLLISFSYYLYSFNYPPVQTFYHHFKSPLALLLALLFLTSCAPVRTGKKRGRPVAKKNKTSIQQRAVGHDLEISLRKGAKKNDLTLLIQDKMDRYDREQTNHVFERGLSGQTSSWTNPDLGNQYRITPLPAYQTIGKSVCRKATIETMLSGNEQLKTMNSKACRAKNGQWRISQGK